MTKLKVVWICHFSNEEVRKNLSLLKLRLLKLIKKILGKNSSNYGDFAPWITNQIKEFENFKDVELHIISPHKGLKKFTYEFKLNEISYHFFKPELLFWVKILREKLFKNIFKNNNKKYRLNRHFVKKFIKDINPDIINLVGTENPYYSASVLDIKDIPIYVTVQTVYTNPNWKKISGEYDETRAKIELKIHKKEKYYGCWGRMFRDLILINNPEAIIFRNSLPKQKPIGIKNVPKEFDFVFFASQISMHKGIIDAIEALSIVKYEKPDVTLNIVGDCENKYLELLNSKITSLDLNNNISFSYFFPLISDMHQHLMKSSFALLPIKLDIISNTIFESMFLGIPVVTYKTSGTPFLNKDGETVLLADIGDIEGLAKNMLRLLNESELAAKLSKNAKTFVEKEFDNTTSAKRLLKTYKAVLAHYYENIPIPEELLFNLNEAKIY